MLKIFEDNKQIVPVSFPIKPVKSVEHLTFAYFLVRTETC